MVREGRGNPEPTENKSGASRVRHKLAENAKRRGD